MGKRIVWTEAARADVRRIEQGVALQILKTLGRFAISGEGATKQLTELRAADSPACTELSCLFRDNGVDLKIDRVLDRKDAYR